MALQEPEQQQLRSFGLGLPDSNTTLLPIEPSEKPPAKRIKRLERVCHVCKKCYSKSEHLKRHLRSHTKERPYTCSTCGKSYSRNDTLLRHERGHTTSVDVGNPLHGSRASSTRCDLESGLFLRQGGNLPTSATTGNVAAESQSRPNAQLLVPQTTVSEFPFSSPNYQEGQNHRLPHNIIGNSAALGYDPSSMSQPSFQFPLPDNLNHRGYSGQLDEEFAPATWLLADDFDVNALENALALTMSDWVQMRPQELVRHGPPTRVLPLSPPTVADRSTELSRIQQPVINTATCRQPDDAVSRQWFTRLPPQSTRIQSRAGSEAPSEQFHVNDRYWDKLSRTLVPRVLDASIPPAEDLNLYLRLYASKFHPMFPVIHLPTFRPNSRNAHLVLSMCSIGSLFIQYPQALAQGRSIFERLHKVVLASWETHLYSSKTEALAMVQTALLGQTFGMLSGKAKDVTMVDAFHGTLLAWARSLGVPKETFALPTHDLSEDEKDRLWREWVHAEQHLRLALAASVHDAELASLLHHESSLQRSIFGRLPRLTHDSLFKAPTATKWYALLREQPPRSNGLFPTLQSWLDGKEDRNPFILQAVQNSRFALYSMLESLNVSIVQARQVSPTPLDVSTIQHFERRLLHWYELDADTSLSHRGVSDPFHTKILWHSAFMALFADFDLLETAVGRDGQNVARSRDDEVCAWASGPHAARCLAHSLLLQDEVEGMQLRTPPALHVPRTVFWAGLVALCYSKHVKPSLNHPLDLRTRDWTEMAVLGPTARARLAEVSASGPGNMIYTVIICRYIDQLQRLGRWGISHTFASILSSALQGIGNGDDDGGDGV